MDIKSLNYRDDNGNIVTKEEFDKEFEIFNKKVEAAYNEIANSIINRIKNTALSDIEKLRMLFDYLTSENMIYDLQDTTYGGSYAVSHGYRFADYKSWKIGQHTKYPVLLNNKGVCKTYALAFEDLATRLGIPCKVVTGFTGMEHAWNIVLINNEVKQIDVSNAIMNRNNKDNFFLKDNFYGRTINESLDSLTLELREIERILHPKIEIISRTDEESVPKITIYKK